MPTNYTGANLVFGADDTLTTTYSYAKFPVWMVREEDGKRYRFVLFDNGTAVASANGAVAYLKTHSTGTVTSDYSDPTPVGVPMGVFLGVVTDGYYCWIQTYGPHSAVVTDTGDDITAGDVLVVSATDGAVTRADFTDTAATTVQLRFAMHTVGFATAADSASAVAAFLTID